MISGCQAVIVRIMALRFVSNLRMQATRTTFLALPAFKRRWQKAAMMGLRRDATNATMYRTALSLAHPPHTVRLPRMVPLSPVGGSDTHHGGDFTAVQLPQLRQLNQEGG